MAVKMSEMPGDRLAPEGRDGGDRSPTDPRRFVRESGPIPAPIPDLGEPIPIPVYKTGIGDHLAPQRLSRRAALSTHHCGQHVLTGLDDDRCALVARVDPYPLSAAGEVAALRSSRHTYYLRHGALERRDRWNIPGHPPCPDLLVLAEHVCGTRPPDDWLAPPSPRPSRPAPEEF